MSIGTVKPRRDGKFLVTLRFSNEHQTLPTLHKVMTREQLDALKAKIESEVHHV